MTIEEKKDAIRLHCEKHWVAKNNCAGCPLHELGALISCSGNDADIERNYELITGLPEIEPDIINHPQHYETGKYECIDVMVEAIGVEAVKSFCLCNAFKYIYRCNKKHETPTDDVSKAVWYLKKFLELEG